MQPLAALQYCSCTAGRNSQFTQPRLRCHVTETLPVLDPPTPSTHTHTHTGQYNFSHFYLPLLLHSEKTSRQQEQEFIMILMIFQKRRRNSRFLFETFRSSFDVVLLKIGGRFKFFYTQNRLGCVFVCLNVIRMSIFVQIDTIIQKLQRYLHKVRHRNTPFLPKILKKIPNLISKKYQIY